MEIKIKTLFVGDIHGKLDIVERALEQQYPVVFVGDIVDSFDKTIEEQLKCLELIFEAIDKEKAQCLYGNHELSYIHPQKMICSGYKSAMQMHFNGGLKEKIETRFKHFLFFEPNILITHAGLTAGLAKSDDITKQLNEWVKDIYSPAYWISRARGGIHSTGGIYWCDFNNDFTPIPELIQIFGHTSGKTLRHIDQSFCIDYNDYSKEQFFFDV